MRTQGAQYPCTLVIFEPEKITKFKRLKSDKIRSQPGSHVYVDHMNRPYKDGWMDDLQFYVLFNSISVILGRCLDDNERLCAMELRVRLEDFTSSEDRSHIKKLNASRQKTVAYTRYLLNRFSEAARKI